MAMPEGPLQKEDKAFELEMEPLGVKLCTEGLSGYRPCQSLVQPMNLSSRGQA